MQKLFERYYTDPSEMNQEDLSLFYRIQEILINKYGVDLPVDSEFYMIMEIISILKEEHIDE